MTTWRITKGPRTYEPGEGRDCDVGWAYDLERDGETRTMRVERSRTAAAAGSRDETARRAVSSRGRSAIEPYLDGDDPPTLLIVSTHGVSPAE